MKYLSIVTIFVCYLFIQACISKECQIPGGYEFEIPVTLSPAKDTFNIGDTITISSVFSDLVYETKTQSYYKLENFRFYPSTGIIKIDSIEAIKNMDDFDIVIGSKYNYGIYTYSSGNRRIEGEYYYENNKYSLNINIIAKNKGLYLFSHGSSIYGLGEWQEFEGKCGNVSSDVSTKLNDGVDNNVAFLNNSPDPHYNDWILQEPDYRFHRWGGYCFYVRE